MKHDGIRHDGMKHDGIKIAVPSNTSPLGGGGYALYIRALLTALLLALAMPGVVGWWPLLFVALIPLLSALGRLSTRQTICIDRKSVV